MSDAEKIANLELLLAEARDGEDRARRALDQLLRHPTVNWDQSHSFVPGTLDVCTFTSRTSSHCPCGLRDAKAEARKVLGLPAEHYILPTTTAEEA